MALDLRCLNIQIESGALLLRRSGKLAVKSYIGACFMLLYVVSISVSLFVYNNVTLFSKSKPIHYILFSKLVKSS